MARRWRPGGGNAEHRGHPDQREREPRMGAQSKGESHARVIAPEPNVSADLLILASIPAPPVDEATDAAGSRYLTSSGGYVAMLILRVALEGLLAVAATRYDVPGESSEKLRFKTHCPVPKMDIQLPYERWSSNA